MSLHRLYFDESGVHSFGRLELPHDRYLALCGLVFEDAAYRAFQEAWEKMKRTFFKGDPDEPIIVHRKEIMGRSGIFSVLEDDVRRSEFDAAFLEIIAATPFVGLIVVVDKAAWTRGSADRPNPYHYCLVALLQRYCLLLGGRRGDVMGESRGKVEDQQLKAAYEALYDGGDLHNRAEFYQARLSSREIKLKPKPKNVAGLQLADLLAHPAKQRCLLRHGVAAVQESQFGRRVADLFWQKIRQSNEGESKDYGEIFLA
jgi:hypothetical protein